MALLSCLHIHPLTPPPPPPPPTHTEVLFAVSLLLWWTWSRTPTAPSNWGSCCVLVALQTSS